MTPDEQRRRDRLWLYWTNVRHLPGAKKMLAKFLGVSQARAAQLVISELSRRNALNLRLSPYVMNRMEYDLLTEMFWREQCHDPSPTTHT